MNWLIAQAPTPDIASYIGTTGPIGAICLAVGFLFNMWLKSRQDKREGSKTERESESGIVETTSEAMKIVREQMKEMREDIKNLKAENAEKDKRIDELETEVRELREGRPRARRPAQRGRAE